MAKEKNTTLLLTSRILADELSRREYNFQFYDRGVGRCLTGCRFLLSETAKPDPHYAYVAPGHAFRAPSGGTVLSLGPANENARTGAFDLIELDASVEPFRLMNDLNDIFTHYREWDLALQRAAESGDVEALAQLGRQQFENPLFIHDAQYNYLVNQRWSGSGSVFIKNQRLGINTVPSAKLHEMFASSAYRETLGTHGAQLFQDFPRVSNRILYVNLWGDDGEWLGRVCIDEIFSSILMSEFYLAEYFAQMILRILRGHRIALSNLFSAVKDELRAVLHREPVDEALLRQNLKQINMKPEDSYQILWITAGSTDRELFRQPNICYELELKFSNSCALLLQDGVLLLMNRTLSAPEEPQLRAGIADVFKGLACRVGVSGCFTGLQNMADYHQQAAYAAAAVQEQPDCAVIGFYRDCALRYLVDRGSRALPPCCRIPEELTLLRQYDDENGTELFRTLKLYLHSDSNMARTAQQLFIHRSTMTYRMEKIVALTRLDLEDSSVKLLLLLGYYILDTEHGQLSETAVSSN